jgi:hypothetical protein
MVVGLSPEQIEACRRALVPVQTIPVPTVREACSSMSTVLPLVVIVDEGEISDADRTALGDMATACGAEIVAVEEGTSVSKGFTGKLLDALRVAERRRLGLR